jgi:hypothetical protein
VSKGEKAKGKKNSGAMAAPDEMEIDTTAIEVTRNVMMVELTRMQPYIAYLLNKELSYNQVEARRIA